MHYENEDTGTSFDIPDRITVRRQLAFRSRVAETAGEGNFTRYWLAAQTVMENWTCPLIDDPAALDLDESDDRRVADIVVWVANTVAGHMIDLATPGKNS